MSIYLYTVRALLWLGRYGSLSALHRVGTQLGRLGCWLRSREYRVAQRNVALCFANLDERQQSDLVRACMEHTGRGLTELAYIWNVPHEALSMIRQVEGRHYLDSALSAGKGVIVAAPHLGAWELLNLYLSSLGPFTLLFKPPQMAQFESLLTKFRGALGAQAVPANAGGVRMLLKRLKAGGMIGILPDQRPRSGEGAHADYFGHPALTMALLSRLANKTGAPVIFAYARRLDEARGYSIHFKPAPIGIADDNQDIALRALNVGVEACVQDIPEQYQWTYKRFSIYQNGQEQVYRLRQRRKSAQNQYSDDEV
jgi:KDO2-lipid IV(A) lauroyltransferase